MGLDTALELTRGNPAGMRAMLAQFHPARGNTTLVATGDDGTVLIGQVTHIINERPAYLTFLMPESAACGPILTDLLDELVSQAGYLGALSIIADAEDDHPAYPCLRKAGFSIFGWQSTWKLPPQRGGQGTWQPVTARDEVAVRNLFGSVIPPLAQSAEPLPTGLPKGFLLRRKGELAAFARVLSGPRGFFLLPVFHPSDEDVTELCCAVCGRVFPGPVNRSTWRSVPSRPGWNRHLRNWRRMHEPPIAAGSLSCQPCTGRRANKKACALAGNH